MRHSDKLNEALIETLRREVRTMYGNGRVNGYPADKFSQHPGAPDFYEWLGEFASDQVEYLTCDRLGTDGRLHGRPDAFEKKYSELILDRFGFLTKLRTVDEKVNGKFTGKKIQYRARDVYQYGRNGKTFAPASFVDDGACWRLTANKTDWGDNRDLVRTIRFIRQFNNYIKHIAACAVPCYEEHVEAYCMATSDDLLPEFTD